MTSHPSRMASSVSLAEALEGAVETRDLDHLPALCLEGCLETVFVLQAHLRQEIDQRIAPLRPRDEPLSGPQLELRQVLTGEEPGCPRRCR